MPTCRRLLILAAILGWGSAAAQDPPKPTAEQEAFFETQVRPLLVKRCFECHGPKTQEAGLRLDSRAAVLRGGESGKVVEPGDPDRSRLMAVLRYDGDVQMPPDGKLADAEREILASWVRMRLPWPAADATKVKEEEPKKPAVVTPEQVTAARAAHWAFQPVRQPPLPEVKNAAWGRTPIDRFILSQLESQGISPSPPADPRTLLRRLTFDLTGLPPTPEQTDPFLDSAIRNPQSAIETLVDNLLASPHYGERWGRHWLDIARYSDTKGYVFTEDPRYPYAYTYRDYVIRSFNDDLPFNQFVLEQLAADQLPLRDENLSLAAMGFLTVGRRFSNNQHDIIDDRIDVVTRGLLGLTVACARCHDHKYDAIPTADYYSLYGVFASSVEPKELPLVGKPQESEAYRKFSQELAEREKELNEFLDKERRELQEEFRARAGDYLAQVVLEKLDKESKRDNYFSISRGEVRPQMVRRWREHLAKVGPKQDAVWGIWHELVNVPEAEFSSNVARVVARLDELQPASVNRLVREAFVAHPPTKLLDVVRVYDQLLSDANHQWQTLASVNRDAESSERSASNANPPKQLPDPAAEELRQCLYGANAPATLKPEEMDTYFDRQTRNKLSEHRKKIEALKASSPAAPPRAMVMNDSGSPSNPRIFLRGNSRSPGAEVPRQFLALLTDDQRKPFAHGSGRLDLAQSIVDPTNPLTARVIVNRVWQQHFGQGLVRTPSDFGVRSEPPTHPELLDWLAAEFIRSGWSIKHIHRLMVQSSTYQQASHNRADTIAKDADNRWCWRMNRRRLEFESTRDALLAVAGTLDRTLGGRAVDIVKPPYSARRTVYGLVDRQDLPDMFRVFDFASPDASTELRPRTTVPQQALFVMNSPFVIEQAKRLAARNEIASQSDPKARVQALFRLVLARAAEQEEVELAIKFIESQSSGDRSEGRLTPWEMYAQVLLLTNEFLFID